ncbi:MAG: sulfur carrier protein ThiS [Clostridia bacterium]|nr:sulfur carrier protein ThiS [Clostridia bacterium]
MIKVNNRTVEWKKELTVEAMLKEEAYKNTLAVIVNGKIIPKNQYSETWINDGDHISLIQTITGG